MKIRCYPDPILMKRTLDVEDFDDDLVRLTREMIVTMHENAGVGLAAVQVGIPRRVFTICMPEVPLQDIALVNPEIIERRGQDVEEEGCLSVPGLQTRVKRATFIVVRAHTIQGEETFLDADGLAARIFQHEIDHLNGITIVNHLSPAGRIAHKQFLKDLEARYRPDNMEE